MDLEGELRKSISEDELEKLIKEKIKSFYGLLTREAAVRLIAKERGMLKEEEKSYQLTDIPKGERKIRFTAKIKKIWPVAAYSSGKKSRVLEMDDKTATKPLILWNEDVDLVKGLRVGDEIAVRGAYERSGELHLGYSGTMEVVNKAQFSDLSNLNEGDSVHLRGVISGIEGHDKFVRNGRTIPGFSFLISDGKSERRCVIFEGLDRANKIELSDETIVEGATVKNGNIEIDESTRLLVRRLKDMLIGQIKKLECNREKLLVEIGNREIILDRENALKFFSVEVAEDISLSTVTDLKKELLLNTKVAIKEKDGQIQ
ncbi:Replication factor A [Candidatus Bilamarchaeum dharawalense]|uniref:Replication factor A n=1 Tax=Candidatus Bilamarchaeum dharawalense TaxID=2885759 RepID=A0A5E4LLA3_9ARCH|nr:Replication factor A [Candidatus Bilamarchaeum dharawalense]